MPHQKRTRYSRAYAVPAAKNSASLLILLSGLLLLTLATLAQASNEKKPEIVSSLHQELMNHPVSADSYLEQANKLLEQEQFSKATDLYTRAILTDRDIDGAFLGRSLAYGGLGKSYESIADLNVFILRNPYHSMAHVYRGVRYMAQGNPEFAEENLQRAIKLNPKNAQAYDDLGVLYAQQGDVRKALNYFGQALRIEPYNETAYHNLAIAYYLLDDNVKALKAVERAILLMPESRDTYILKAQILETLGQTAQAREVRAYADFLQEPGTSQSVSIN